MPTFTFNPFTADLDAVTSLFTELTDVPTSYTSQAGKVVAVKSTEDGLEFITPGGGGTVTSVTASLPLSSSGGTTPNISISQSGGSTNGYLSSTDWTIFNNKGDVVGPASATDNAIARYDGTTGKLIQNSGITIADGASGTLSGTNTGDQTSIVGITGTKAQFNTALTDGDFLFVGDITAYTDEQAQDAVGTILVDSSSIDFTYNDATPSITAVVLPAGVDHNSLANLTVGDVHTQYVLLAGRAGGQTIIGGTIASNDLTLQSTTDATRGKINATDSFQYASALQASGYINATVGTNQNDWSPTGIGTASIIRITTSAAFSITGINSVTGGTANNNNERLLTIVNLGSDAVTLVSESASSVASNRFNFPVPLGGLANFILYPGNTITLWGDATTDRWRQVANTHWDSPVTSMGMNMNTSRVIGRTTASTGAPEEISVTAPLSLSAGALTTSMATARIIGRTTAGTGVMEEISIGDGLSLASGILSSSSLFVLDRNVTVANIGASSSSENSVYSYSVPANTMSTNKTLNVKIDGSYLNTSGASRTITVRIKFGGTTIYADTITLGAGAANRAMAFNFSITNNGAANAQTMNGSFEYSSVTAPTTGIGDLNASTLGRIAAQAMAIDTTSAQTVEVTVQHSAIHASLYFTRNAARTTLE